MIRSDYQNHGVWSAIESADNQFNSFSEEEKEDARFKELSEKLDYTKWLLETSNSAFLNVNDLQTITQQLNSVQHHSINDANNWSHYDQISNAFATIFSILSYPRIQKIFRSEANEAIEEFTAKISTVKTDLSETIENTESKIDEEIGKLKSFVGGEKTDAEALFGEVKTEQTKVQESLAGIQDEISVLDSKMQAQFEVWEANNTSQITDKLSELSEVFTEAQTDRSDTFQNQKNEVSSALANLKDSIKTVHKDNTEHQKIAKETLAQAKSELEAQAKDVLEKINGFYEKAGQTALSGDFLSSAETESKSFGRYSVIAGVFIILSAVILGWMWLTLAKSDVFKFSELAMRVPVSIIFLFPGLYFASLANQHRKSATKLRSLGLRIKAFDAYLVNADDTQKKELRKELAKVFFEDSPAEKDGKMGIFGHQGKNVGQMIEVVNKLVEKVPPSSN